MDLYTGGELCSYLQWKTTVRIALRHANITSIGDEAFYIRAGA